MKVTNELGRLHEEITRQITEENNREMAESIAENRAEAEAAEKKTGMEMKAFEAMGLNVTNLEALELEQNEVAKADSEKMDAQMVEQSQALSFEPELDVEESYLPPDAFRLTPSWSALFSDNDIQDALTDESADSSDIAAQAVVGPAQCKRYWNRARGAGGGCIGGRASINTYAEFGFWFKPAVSKFYGVRPLFRFRGFYRVYANDKWYNCKYARVLVAAQTNCYQYNWKGWNNVDVLDVRGGNINVNKRFDADRHTYNSYLLAGGDWAYIRARVRLYAYGKGGGSEGYNNYYSGTANKLCVPHVHVD